MTISLYDRLENTVGKGENAGNQHFLLFPQCFPKPSSLELLKVRIVLEKLNVASMIEFMFLRQKLLEKEVSSKNISIFSKGLCCQVLNHFPSIAFFVE